MNKSDIILAGLGALALSFSLEIGDANAQTPELIQPGTNQAVGQGPGQTINQAQFLANTDSVGFSEQSQSTIAGVGTIQAGAAVIQTRSNIATCTSGQTALQLPAVQRYTAINIMNRGSVSCLVFPTNGGFLETTAGTLAAVNVSMTLAAGTDVTFKPAIIGSQSEWLQ